MTRRELIQASLVMPVGGLLQAAGARAPGTDAPAAARGPRFIHLTDPHIQPELRAADGCTQCFERINQLAPDFVIVGGDVVFDAAEVGQERAARLFALWQQAASKLRMPVYHVVGNHDIFGVGTASGVSPSHPSYGKRMFEDLLGKRYYAFEQRGWHFIVLDSIGITADRRYEGRIDEEQLAWLANELAGIPKTKPLVVATHIALATTFLQVAGSQTPPDMLRITNGSAVLDLLWPYNLKLVLQGHTHIREIVQYRGCQFITSGAVSGNWWRGARFGHPEGFGVITATAAEAAWQYETYGFVAEAPAA